MQTFAFEACQSLERPGNWGKFMVAVPDDQEWSWPSEVCPGMAPLLQQCGWSRRHIWACDLQTGEGAFFLHGGYARADLERHRIWVCLLFEAWLGWLYRQDLSKFAELPRVVELPDAEFGFYGYRRPGPVLEIAEEILSETEPCAEEAHRIAAQPGCAACARNIALRHAALIVLGEKESRKARDKREADEQAWADSEQAWTATGSGQEGAAAL